MYKWNWDVFWVTVLKELKIKITLPTSPGVSRRGCSSVEPILSSGTFVPNWAYLICTRKFCDYYRWIFLPYITTLVMIIGVCFFPFCLLKASILLNWHHSFSESLDENKNKRVLPSLKNNNSCQFITLHWMLCIRWQICIWIHLKNRKIKVKDHHKALKAKELCRTSNVLVKLNDFRISVWFLLICIFWSIFYFIINK